MQANTAIILCGGLGTRLASVVADKPKSMALVSGKPFLEILMKNLVEQGISKFILATGYLHDEIQEYFGQSFLTASVTYSREDKPLGTGGAIRLAAQKVEDYPVLVCNGDSFVEFSLNGMKTSHLFHKQPIILLREMADTTRFGSVEVSSNRITKFGEKNRAGKGFINAGVYLLDKATIAKLPALETFSFEKDFLETQIPKVEFRAQITEGKFIDIGTPGDYLKAQQDLN